jgi:hypothetical protein
VTSGLRRNRDRLPPDEPRNGLDEVDLAGEVEGSPVSGWELVGWTVAGREVLGREVLGREVTGWAVRCGDASAGLAAVPHRVQ